MMNSWIDTSFNSLRVWAQIVSNKNCSRLLLMWVNLGPMHGSSCVNQVSTFEQVYMVSASHSVSSLESLMLNSLLRHSLVSPEKIADLQTCYKMWVYMGYFRTGLRQWPATEYKSGLRIPTREDEKVTLANTIKWAKYFAGIPFCLGLAEGKVFK